MSDLLVEAAAAAAAAAAVDTAPATADDYNDYESMRSESATSNLPPTHLKSLVLDSKLTTLDILNSAREQFEMDVIQGKNNLFLYEFVSADMKQKVKYAVRGAHTITEEEVGQQTSSNTCGARFAIGKGAEVLCQYIIDNVERFRAKAVCELGAGVGLVSVLLERLDCCSKVVATDGDEDAMEILIDNKIDNLCLFDSSFLFWGEHDDFLSEHPEKFDILLAADAVHDEGEVGPLFETVCALLKDSPDAEFILAISTPYSSTCNRSSSSSSDIPLITKVLESASKQGLKCASVITTNGSTSTSTSHNSTATGSTKSNSNCDSSNSSTVQPPTAVAMETSIYSFTWNR